MNTPIRVKRKVHNDAPFQNLAISTNGDAKILHYHIMEHPATKHVRIGPLWSGLYLHYKNEKEYEILAARTIATLKVMAMLDEVAKVAGWEIPARELPT